jgi:hypothetical protein
MGLDRRLRAGHGVLRLLAAAPGQAAPTAPAAARAGAPGTEGCAGDGDPEGPRPTDLPASVRR